MRLKTFNLTRNIAIWIGFVISIIQDKQLMAILFILIIILSELEDIHATIKSVSVQRQAQQQNNPDGF